MERGQAELERVEPVRRRLDDELALVVDMDLALPAIDGLHRRQHVHAGRQVLVDQRLRQADATSKAAPTVVSTITAFMCAIRASGTASAV